jgi:hypothetical protein
MEERNERNAGKNRTPQKQHAAKINRYFSTHTHREKKKRIKNSRYPFILSRKKRKKKFSVDDPYRTTMAT